MNKDRENLIANKLAEFEDVNHRFKESYLAIGQLPPHNRLTAVIELQQFYLGEKKVNDEKIARAKTADRFPDDCASCYIDTGDLRLMKIESYQDTDARPYTIRWRCNACGRAEDRETQRPRP